MSVNNAKEIVKELYAKYSDSNINRVDNVINPFYVAGKYGGLYVRQQLSAIAIIKTANNFSMKEVGERDVFNYMCKIIEKKSTAYLRSRNKVNYLPVLLRHEYRDYIRYWFSNLLNKRKDTYIHLKRKPLKRIEERIKLLFAPGPQLMPPNITYPKRWWEGTPFGILYAMVE